MEKILIDCDTGIDDSLALLFAALREDVRLVGVVASCGNTGAAQAAENTLRVLRLVGRDLDIPVAVGAETALDGSRPEPIPHIHGHNGIGDVELAASAAKPLAQDGVDFLVDTVRRHAGDITLVTLGRLTDVALALQAEPELPRMVKRLVVMGGTLYRPGNVGPMSEANIKGDAVAADTVLRAGFDLTLVGLDVTMKTRLTPDLLDALERGCAPENRAAAQYLRAAFENVYIPFNRSQSGTDDCPLHDPLAMLAAIDPAPFTFETLSLRVDCGSGADCGRLIPGTRPDGESTAVSVAVDVDANTAREAILSVFY